MAGIPETHDKTWGGSLGTLIKHPGGGGREGTPSIAKNNWESFDLRYLKHSYSLLDRISRHREAGGINQDCSQDNYLTLPPTRQPTAVQSSVFVWHSLGTD